MVFVSDNWILFLTDWVVFYLVGAGFDCFLKRTTNSGVLACLDTFVFSPGVFWGFLVFLGVLWACWRGGVCLARDCLLGWRAGVDWRGRAGARESVCVAWFPGWCFLGLVFLVRDFGRFTGAGRLDMLCAGVVVGARFLGCWEFCGVGRFCDCLAGCAGRCKKRVFWLCQVVGRFPGRAGVWSSVPTYGCVRAIPARGVCFGSDWIVRSFCFDWRERFHVVVIGA